MERAQRRIPVQYAKRVVGRKVYGGAGTYIPLKINGANVIPIIFASAILYFPVVHRPALERARGCSRSRTRCQPRPACTGSSTSVLIVFFTYFYTALVFNPIDLADNLRKQGGFIPGVRPGKATVDLHRERAEPDHAAGRAVPRRRSRSCRRMLFERHERSPLLQQFGGTSILIMVGVALETMTQLESQLKMRHYDGFFK